MDNISDIIEHYLNQILEKSDAGVIEIKRSELADIFQCVPSQINYVISTRFTAQRGFVVESKRGGGGYIRIRRMQLGTNQDYFNNLFDNVGQSIPQITAEHVLSRLLQDKMLTERESLVLKRILSREVLQLPIPVRDEIRARMLKTIIMTIFSSKGE